MNREKDRDKIASIAREIQLKVIFISPIFKKEEITDNNGRAILNAFSTLDGNLLTKSLWNVQYENPGEGGTS